MASTENPERTYKILAYGFERRGLQTPSEPLRTKYFDVFFEEFHTARRFQEYDGVVLFQGIFERFERKNGAMSAYLRHSYDVDELDKRKKESKLLLDSGGFICHLLTDPFLDNDDGRDFSRTDLTKFHLSYGYFHRRNFNARVAHITFAHTYNEFKNFFDVFGAAFSYFENFNDELDCRPLATFGERTVGLLINRSEYFVPSLLPESRTLVEYLTLLLGAVTAAHNKLHQILPEWVDSYKFDEEDTLASTKAELLERVNGIDRRFEELNRFKSALFHSGEELVADVSAILQAALGLKIDATDELREDVKLLDDSGKIVALCEIKGINRGVGRENINQTDSHRERSGYDESFPAVLIANTNIKSARSIADKEQQIDAQQIRHAVKMRILVMRTIDLLGLLRLVLGGELSQEGARQLVLENTGWLRVSENSIAVLDGQ